MVDNGHVRLQRRNPFTKIQQGCLRRITGHRRVNIINTDTGIFLLYCRGYQVGPGHVITTHFCAKRGRCTKESNTQIPPGFRLLQRRPAKTEGIDAYRPGAGARHQYPETVLLLKKVGDFSGTPVHQPLPGPDRALGKHQHYCYHNNHQHSAYCNFLTVAKFHYSTPGSRQSSQINE